MAPFLSFVKKNKKDKAKDGSTSKGAVRGDENSQPFDDRFEEDRNFKIRDGYMRPAYRGRAASHSQSRSSGSHTVAHDGPTPEDYARWNNPSPPASRLGHERSTSFSMARSYAPDVSGDHQALVEQITAERQRVPEPAPVPVPVPVSMSATSSTPNKLRRRTVSGPTPSSSFTQPLKSSIPAPSASGSNTVTATLQGEDPLKRMKYDLQVTTFLLNKLKSSSSNPNPPRHYEPPPKQPHPRPLRQVDPRNLVDPWIDGRHGTEFHQIHNHGLLLHPSYGGGYPYQPSAQSRSALDPRRTQTPAPAVDKRVNQWVDEHSGGGGRRKRYASDAAAHRPAHPPPVTSYHRPSTSTSSHPQFVPPPHPPPGSSRSSGSSRAEDHYHHYPSSSQPQPQPPPVFGNFRQPSYSYTPAQGQPSGSGGGRHKKRQSMPVILRPETIMPTLEPETIVPLDPVDAHYRMGNVDSSGGGPRRVRFRGADSVIGSPSPRKAVFTSLPQRGR